MPVYITEYAALARDAYNFHISAGKEPAAAEQVMTISGTSSQSAVFNEQTAFIMVHTTEVACLAFGSNPTAVSNRHRVGAGETRFYGVNPGHRMAAIVGT
jgi:hypothetical protein